MIRIRKTSCPAYVGLLASWLAAAAPVLADASAPTALAEAEFNRGEYAAALRHFVAVDKQNRTPQTRYNIGVCHYRLGQFSKARKQFLTLVDEPRLGSLALYNLALIAAKQDDEEAALHWLERTFASEPDKKLLSLARTLQARLQSKPESRRWDAAVSLGSGYDDNVLLIADTTTASASASAFTEANAYIGGKWRRYGEWSAGFFGNHYANAAQYDTNALYFSSEYIKALGGGNAVASASAAYATLAGASYSNDVEVAAEWEGEWRARRTWNVGYRLARINALDPAYDGIEGWRHRFVVDGDWWRHASGRTTATYRLELNRRRSDGVSPLRHTFAVGHYYSVNSRFDISGLVEYRVSDYSAVNRREDRYSASLTANYRLKASWRLQGRVRHVTNRSSAALYGYGQNEVIASLLWSF